MNTVLCPNCHSPNRPGSRFCVRCGGALGGAVGATGSAACPNCGSPIPPGSSFCASCGTALAGPPSPPAGARSASGGGPTLIVRWPGGQRQEYPLRQGSQTVGRTPGNDITLNFPTVSKQHLRLDVSGSNIQITDLGSTNGVMVNGRKIAPNTPHPWHTSDVIRVGDLRGNSISLVLKGHAEQVARTSPLGMHKLAHLSQVLIGRDPSSHVFLDHPMVSRNHAEIVQQGGNYMLRDLGSSNGTFVNGQRVAGWVPVRMGDVIQVGPYKLVYDGQVQSLAASVSRGHRLDVISLGKKVPDGRMILLDINLSVGAGEFISLVGGSGAGKSTLLKCMNGFNPATHGHMLIDGEPLYPNLEAYRTLMGYVPQDDIIHKELPVRSALWYAAKLRLPDASNQEIEQRIKSVLEMVELTEHAGKPVKVLSGGQRKRVSIAVELLPEPDLLFLDEPTSGLDPGLEKKMMYDLNRLADQGKTVVLVTHATGNIEQCDHVAFLEKGNLAYYGPPRDAITFFKARDFSDIYLRLSSEVNPAAGKNPPPELQAYLPAAQTQLTQANTGARLTEGLLWAQHYRNSPTYNTYVATRQAEVAGGRGQRSANAPEKPQRQRDSAFRQIFILARRQFDLIRHDVRTLFILLLMMPLIGFLFMFVSDKQDLVGKQLPREVIEEQLTAELENEPPDTSVDYMPEPTASQLVTMLGLALTQAGTFGAAYEIVKERAVFKREKAVNLRVGAYVLSKVLVLGAFALIQVASVLLVVGLKVDMGFDPTFDFMPSGAIELFVTLFFAVLASIMLGLFISAMVPTPDVVLYIILVQLFAQIILSGAMFPLPDNPVQKAVISHWTMDAMGSTIDIPKLNEETIVCSKWEQEVPTAEGGTETQTGVTCESRPRDPEDLGLNFEHSEEHLLTTWIALFVQAVFWGGATTIVQARKKTG
ncbi:MAG: FHA domain-containing protein [Anaerolineae bacterium]|nr:FHA domain-containing protein [Anaerolineae bacterium]